MSAQSKLEQVKELVEDRRLQLEQEIVGLLSNRSIRDLPLDERMQVSLCQEKIALLDEIASVVFEDK